MKGTKKAAKNANQNDTPAVYDVCGVDVNDPVGNHTVNFTLSIEAKEDPSKPFEGDVDISFPHPLPKGAKPPKIEIGHPDTNWNNQYQLNIDDAFINAIKDKRLMYKITFLYKSQAHGKTPSKSSNKKGADKGAPHVTNHTFFVDASCLLMRGGRFKPILTYTASCVPPSFTEFKFTVTIDQPLLSDAQIRRHQPTVCYLKGIHQLPDKPLTYEELAATCVGPFIVMKSPTLANPMYTYPVAHGPDIKYNIAVMFWQTPSTEITIELHDRDVENPEQSNIIGSAFVIPDPTVKTMKAEALSIDAILGVKKDTVAQRPFGVLTFNLETGRYMIPFKPVQTRESVVQVGAFITAGTYMTIEVEAMKEYVSQTANSIAATPTTKTRGGGGGGGAATEKHGKEDKNQQKPTFSLQRVVIIARGTLTKSEQSFINEIQSNIVKYNAIAFNQKDIACVPSMKIDKEDSDAISGFIIMTGEFELTVLELMSGSSASEGMMATLEKCPKGNIEVFSDPQQTFKSPRLYGGFDCAVKKFKLQIPLSELLLDPQLYVQNSHLSNCFVVTSKLKTIEKAESLADFEKENIWPTQQELEMLNAKKGCLLSLDELAFPPRSPEDQEVLKVQQRELSALDLINKQETEFTYVPLKKSVKETCNRNLDFYMKRNFDTIKAIEEKKKVDPKIISQSDDGETIVCLKGDKVPDGFIIENPEEHKSLAEFTGGKMFLNYLREENGTETRGNEKFYNYTTPKSVLPDKNELKVDQNFDPWDKGDKPLASASDRLFSNIRGPVYSNYNTVLKEGGLFDPNPGNVNDTYNDKVSDEKVFITKGKTHAERFKNVVVPAGVNEEILGRTVAPPTLKVEEKYVSPEEIQLQNLKRENMERSLRPKFNTLFKAPMKKGTTDSAYVAKIVPTFPTAKPTF